MKLGRTLVISLLFCATIWVYIFQHRIDKDAVSIIPDEVSRNFSLSAEEQVVRIEIENRSQKTELALDFLKDDGWMITAPGTYVADQKKVQALIPVLRVASKQTRIRAEKDWAEYGLETPQLEVSLITDQKKKATLIFGSASPIGKAIYARWTSERGYILLPPEMRSVFETTLYGIREKRIFRLPSQEIDKVSVKMGSLAHEWKKDDGKWYWFEPVSKFGKEMPARSMRLVLSAIADLYVKEFFDKNTKPKNELGFYIIHDRIKLEGAGGTEEALYFGNEIPLQNAYYGMDADEAVFLVDRVKVFQLLDVLRNIENETDAKDTAQLERAFRIEETDL